MPGIRYKNAGLFCPYPQKKTPEGTAAERAMENIRVAR